MIVSHLKKGDTVVALSGSVLGQKGTVLAVRNKDLRIQVEGLGTVKKHVKPSQQNPKGGVIEKLRWWPASKFQVCDAAGNKLGRAGSKMVGDKKERTFSSERKK
jgi:large subunit ribosomal protein L24